MSKLMPVLLLLGCFIAQPARAQDAKAKDDGKAAAAAPAKADAKDQGKVDEKTPETIAFEKTAKMAAVKFPHHAHQKKFDCKECHEGDKPLFAKEHKGEGLKMADLYAGKACGACHDGKKAFAAKSGCMKCHKK